MSVITHNTPVRPPHSDIYKVCLDDARRVGFVKTFFLFKYILNCIYPERGPAKYGSPSWVSTSFLTMYSMHISFISLFI